MKAGWGRMHVTVSMGTGRSDSRNRMHMMTTVMKGMMGLAGEGMMTLGEVHPSVAGGSRWRAGKAVRGVGAQRARI